MRSRTARVLKPLFRTLELTTMQHTQWWSAQHDGVYSNQWTLCISSSNRLAILEELNKGKEWKRYHSRKFSMRRLDLEFVARELTRGLKTLEGFIIFQLSHGYYIFRFVNLESWSRLRLQSHGWLQVKAFCYGRIDGRLSSF